MTPSSEHQRSDQARAILPNVSSSRPRAAFCTYSTELNR